MTSDVMPVASELRNPVKTYEVFILRERSADVERSKDFVLLQHRDTIVESRRRHIVKSDGADPLTELNIYLSPRKGRKVFKLDGP